MDFKPGDKVICVRISMDYANPPYVGHTYIYTAPSKITSWFWGEGPNKGGYRIIDFLIQDFMLYDSLDEFEKLIFEK